MGSEGVDGEVGKNLYKVCEEDQRAKEERLAEAEGREETSYLLITLPLQLLLPKLCFDDHIYELFWSPYGRKI